MSGHYGDGGSDRDEYIFGLEHDLQAARARLDEVLRLGREMREAQRLYAIPASLHFSETLAAAEAAFDAALSAPCDSPGDNAAGS